MKKINLLILLCWMLISFFSTGIYAQENTQQYSNGEFEFEFEVELVYDNDDDDSDDDNDDDSDDDDDDDNDNNQQLLGVEITVTNTGDASINNDILFRAYVAEEVPETTPDTYHEEEIMNLLDTPLESGNSEDIFIDIDLAQAQKRGGGRVIIIWPLVDANKSKSQQDAPFVAILIPKTKMKNKLNLNGFSNINIYPNPTRNILNVDIPEHTPSNQIIIYDKTGQAIRTFDGTASGLNVLNLNELLPGIHFITIRNEHGQTIYCTKIAIQR